MNKNQIFYGLSHPNICRYFHDPLPEYRIVSEAVSTLEDGLNRSLRSGVNRACTFNVPFRADVYRFLFKIKERTVLIGLVISTI